MLEILQFIFGNFFTWLGTVIMLGAISMGIGGLFGRYDSKDK